MPIIKTVNPTTNKELQTYNLFTDEEVKDLLDASQLAFHTYKNSTFEYRSRLMNRVAEILDERKTKYAKSMTLEMGKTFQSALAEVEKCAWVCRYYAELAEGFLADEIIKTEATKSMIVYKPLGVILAVMPWNYPMWQVFRFAVPALMAGNVGILKHASNVPQTALLIEEVFMDAGFSEGVFKTLLIDSSQVETILKNPIVRAATLTGSELAGAAVAAISGSQLKRTVLELGGSDPYIILKDADIEFAAEQCKTSRLINAGQSCIGAKRFVVVKEVYDEFLSTFTNKMKSTTLGNPMDDVDLGPMARHDLRDDLHQQVLKSIEKGADLIIGGKIPNNAGAFYPPTILSNVGPGMPAYEEEMFGPVAAVIKANDEMDAIRIANDTVFGLGACVFTKDIERGEHIAKNEIDAGCCFVNQFVKSDPRLPFGGIKNSGYGRELSYYGIREFVNIKTVYIK